MRNLTAWLLISFICVSLSTATAQEVKIASDAKSTHPLKIGQPAPEVSFQDIAGKPVSLASLHAKQPIVLVFFRGGWCPFCTKHTQELIKAYPRIKELGAELYGVSPDNPESSNANVDKNSIPFPILSDADVTAISAFGLAFEVDSDTLQRYTGFGIDLEKASGKTHHALPIPAVYIIDRSGKLVFAHSNPDYRQRLDTKTIVAELEKLK